MKNINPILFLVLLFSLSKSVNGQEFNIFGRVIEQSTTEALPAASVAIYSSVDSVLVKGTVADTAGIFKIDQIGNGNYYIVFSFIGFISDTLSVNLKPFFNSSLLKYYCWSRRIYDHF